MLAHTMNVSLRAADAAFGHPYRLHTSSKQAVQGGSDEQQAELHQ